MVAAASRISARAYNAVLGERHADVVFVGVEKKRADDVGCFILRVDLAVRPFVGLF